MSVRADTATANAETEAGRKEHVLAAPAVEPAYTPGPYRQDDAEGSAPPMPGGTFELAMTAARLGHPQEGIQMLMREMAQERSGRGRFYQKIQLTKLCDPTGYDALAFPVLAELA